MDIQNEKKKTENLEKKHDKSEISEDLGTFYTVFRDSEVVAAGHI